jgi:hypothetical protein
MSRRCSEISVPLTMSMLSLSVWQLLHPMAELKACSSKTKMGRLELCYNGCITPENYNLHQSKCNYSYILFVFAAALPALRTSATSKVAQAQWEFFEGLNGLAKLHSCRNYGIFLQLGE